MNPPISVLYIHHTGEMDGSSISLLNLISILDRDPFEPGVLLAKDGIFRQILEAQKYRLMFYQSTSFGPSPGLVGVRGHFFIISKPSCQIKNWKNS